MIFGNREQAAHLLAERLTRYRGRNPLILAIPRGAVAMAAIIADELGGEADVVLVRKLRAPDQPELAIGSIDETGQSYIRSYARMLDVGEDYFEKEKRSQLEILRERRALYTPVHPPINPSGRIVIIVDDGIATGSTMIAALRAVEAKRPSKLIVATAVASQEALQAISGIAEEIVCLEVPEKFYAVGQFFREFGQVTDQEVMDILQKNRARTKQNRS
jgi:predicted phosphoribosyltransferase